MNRLAVKVDQPLMIGQGIRMVLTDIDATGVRLKATGRVLGGPRDGDPFEKTHEMSVGSSLHFGPHVVVTLVAIRNAIAYLDIFTPANVSVTSG
jgi:sRNA-binding carbon storage regulator CsrA